MSKTIKHRKRLALETQTLRVLSSDELAAAAGGWNGAEPGWRDTQHVSLGRCPPGA